MKMTITELLAKRKAGDLTDADIKGLWYDWFCKDTSLVNKGKVLLSRLSKVAKVNNGKFNPDNTYVFFKNNCPCNGDLYDDFRICDIETGDVIWTVVPRSGFNANLGHSVLWGKVNDFDSPVIDDTWGDIVKYFGE